MKSDHRNFIIISKHKRLTRLWQFFFTGWGLVMVAVLVAASLFTKQILWTPISAINIGDMANNEFKITNANFVGIDKDNHPFNVHAVSGLKKYKKPDIIFLEKPSGSVKIQKGKDVVEEKFSADNGKYNIKENTFTLTGHVVTESSDGEKRNINEMVIKVK